MLTAGTLGVTAGVMVLVGCLVAAAPEPEATVEFLSEPHDGLESGADEGPEAGARTGVSEPDWLSLQSAAAEPLLEDAGEEVGLRGVGGGGLDGLGGRTGLSPVEDTDGDPVLFTDLRPLGEDLCSMLSTAGELSRLCLME